MEDLMSTTTAEQKFMFMMFERLEKLEDEVRVLQKKNKELEDVENAKPKLPTNVYTGAKYLDLPTDNLFCTIILKDKSCVEPAFKSLSEIYHSACLPDVYPSSELGVDPTFTMNDQTNKDEIILLNCLLDCKHLNFVKKPFITHIEEINGRLAHLLAKGCHPNIECVACTCDIVMTYYVNQLRMAPELVLVDCMATFFQWYDDDNEDLTFIGDLIIQLDPLNYWAIGHIIDACGSCNSWVDAQQKMTAFVKNVRERLDLPKFED